MFLKNPHSGSLMKVTCPFFDDTSFKRRSFYFWEVFLGKNCFLDIRFVITIPVMHHALKKFHDIPKRREKG